GLLLDVAVAFLAERGCVVVMGALPRPVINRPENFLVHRRARVWKHWHRFAYPDARRFEPLLPGANHVAIVLLGENQVRLYPGNALARIDQELRQSVSRKPATFVQFVATFLRDGLNTAFHRDAMRLAEQVQGLFIPEIDAGLQSDAERALGNFLQYLRHLLPYPENFIDPVDVVNASRYQPIHLCEDVIYIALAEFVSKEC